MKYFSNMSLELELTITSDVEVSLNDDVFLIKKQDSVIVQHSYNNPIKFGKVVLSMKSSKPFKFKQFFINGHAMIDLLISRSNCAEYNGVVPLGTIFETSFISPLSLDPEFEKDIDKDWHY
jgi:hypothetical protein